MYARQNLEGMFMSHQWPQYCETYLKLNIFEPRHSVSHGGTGTVPQFSSVGTRDRKSLRST